MGHFPGFLGRMALIPVFLLSTQCAFSPEQAAEGASVYTEQELVTTTYTLPTTQYPATMAPPTAFYGPPPAPAPSYNPPPAPSNPPPPAAAPSYQPPPANVQFIFVPVAQSEEEKEKKEKKPRSIKGFKRMLLSFVVIYLALSFAGPVVGSLLLTKSLPGGLATLNYLWLAMGALVFAVFLAIYGFIVFVLSLIGRILGF